MTDIVERLTACSPLSIALAHEAADEIERLRAALATMADRLGEAANALSEAEDGLRYWEPVTDRGARERKRIVAFVSATNASARAAISDHLAGAGKKGGA